jgi:hypothetical protein
MTANEDFTEELKDKGAYCETVCDNKYAKKNTSTKTFWIVVAASALVILAAIGWSQSTTKTISEQGKQIEFNTDNIRDLNGWRATLSDKIDKYHEEEMQAIKGNR